MLGDRWRRSAADSGTDRSGTAVSSTERRPSHDTAIPSPVATSQAVVVTMAPRVRMLAILPSDEGDALHWVLAPMHCDEVSPTFRYTPDISGWPEVQRGPRYSYRPSHAHGPVGRG